MKAKAIPVNERLPESGHHVPLIFIYGNGNWGKASGYYDEENKLWEIEWSDDHPNSEDITHWIEIISDTDLRKDNIALRNKILGE